MHSIYYVILFFPSIYYANSIPLNSKNQIQSDHAFRQRRQAPFDELIQSALQLVRPIFGSAKSIARGVVAQQQQQESPMMGKKPSDQAPRLSSARLRELDILGLGGEKELLLNNGDMDVMPPICQGNSRICKFIACTAHNFKQDQNFANLQLAAQLLADKKLRRTVGANAGAIGDVCKEQGMSGTECAIFSRAFQLIDRFMTTIEEQEENRAQLLHEAEEEAKNGGSSVLHEEGDDMEEKQQEKMHRHLDGINGSAQNSNKSNTATKSNSTKNSNHPKTTRKPTIVPTTTKSTITAAEKIFEPLDDEPVNPKQPSKSAESAGSRSWSVQRKQIASTLHQRDISEFENHVKDGDNLSAIRRPQPPNTPPRAFAFSSSSSSVASTINQEGKQKQMLESSQRRLISYSTVPMHVLALEHQKDDGMGIVISRRQPVPTAQRVPTATIVGQTQAQPLGRPKQHLHSTPTTSQSPITLFPTLSIGQQLPLQQWPIQQQIPQFAFNTLPPIIVGSTTIQTTTTASRSSNSDFALNIPEAEEFVEEDEAEDAQMRMLDNELNNWMIRLRDSSNDYYDDLENSEEKVPNERIAQKPPKNQTNSNLETEEIVQDDDDDVAQIEEIGRRRQSKTKQDSMLDNCLQYLG